VPGRLPFFPNTFRFINAARFASHLGRSFDSTIDSLGLLNQNWISIIEKLQDGVDEGALHNQHLVLVSNYSSLAESQWYHPRATTPFLDDRCALVRQVAILLIQARVTGKIDLIQHLGVDSNRWDLVAWMVRVLTERKATDNWQSVSPLHNRPSDGSTLDEFFMQKLFSVPCVPDSEVAQMVKSLNESEEASPSSVRPLSSIYSTGLSSHYETLDGLLQHTAIGIVLWSLGRLILTARKAAQPAMSDTAMNQVLNILSILHHNDMIPLKTYAFDTSFEQGDRQTPLLADLYQPMLFSILDAEWNTFQADIPEAAKYESIASAPVPNFQFPTHDTNPSNLVTACHEVWLELLLWVMLRGGWLGDGANLIGKAQRRDWTCQPASSMYSEATGKRVWNIPSCTLSAELIAGYADAMAFSLPEGQWATSGLAEVKEMLKTDNSSGAITWDNLVVRALSENSHQFRGLDANMRNILNLAAPVERLEQIEDTKKPEDELPSSLPTEPDAPLDSELMYGSNYLNGFLHQILWEDLYRGDILAAVETLLSIKTDQRDSSELQFPGSNKLPEHILTALVDAVVALDPVTLGPRMLFPPETASQASLIDRSDYSKPLLARSLIKYATIVNDDKLLRDILRENRRVDTEHHPLVSIALMEAQIESQRWSSAERTISSLQNSRALRREFWVPVAIANLAKALIKIRSLQRQVKPDSDESKALNDEILACSQILGRLVDSNVKYADRRQKALVEERVFADEIRSLLGLLSSIDDSWLAFCRPHFTTLRSQPLVMKETTFLIILEAVADFEGFKPAWKLFTKWCQNIDHVLSDSPKELASERFEELEANELNDVEEEHMDEQGSSIVAQSLDSADDLTGVEDTTLQNMARETESDGLLVRKHGWLAPLRRTFAHSNWVVVDLEGQEKSPAEADEAESGYSIGFRGRVPASLLIVRSMLVRAPEHGMDSEDASAVEALLKVMEWRMTMRQGGEHLMRKEMELIRTIKMLRSR
jgi:hypothetical protein